MSLVLAWLWAPLVLYAVALGLGFLLDRVLSSDLPGALLAPVGLAAAILVATLGYRIRVPELVPVLLVVLAVVGFVVARADLRRAWQPVALLAAVLVYALYMAPVVATGTATWLGYNFVNDTASNFLLIDLLGAGGVKAPTEESGGANIAAYLVAVGYPMGSFSVVAGIKPLTGVGVESLYQPMIAAMAAFGAMSLTEIARRARLRPVALVVAAVLPFGGVLLYRYALHGAIKEVLLVSLLVAAVALAAVALERRLPVRLVALVAMVAMAMVLVFSSAAGLFALCLGIAMLVAAALMPERPSLGHVGRLVGVTVALGVVALIPVLGSVLDFTQNIRGVFDASSGARTGELGQLVRPLPLSEAAGVWISREYRFPADGPFNQPLVAIALLAAAAGIVLCAVKRWFAPLMLLAAVLVPALVISPLASPYIDAKLLVILTPVVVFLGLVAGLQGVQSRRWVPRIAGGLLLAGLVIGVALSDLYSYREVRVAPLDRVDAMKDAAAHAPGNGLYLLNEWEEYGKVFMDAARINPAAEADAPRPIALRSDVGLGPRSPRRTPIAGRAFDLDRQTLEYVDGFAGIIMRRSPAASRPPANFRKTYSNDFYEVWRRTRGPRVREHLPLQSRDRAVRVPDCGAVRALARKARPGDRLLAAEAPRVARLSPLVAPVRPPGWPPSGAVEGALTSRGPGVVRGSVSASGTQRVYLRASALRKLTVFVDGRKVGTAAEMNTPDQWIDVGSVRLDPGQHRIEVRRGSRTLHPGDSYYGYVGPVALQAHGRARLVPVAPRDADSLCGRPWDWIELVSGRS